MRDDLVLWNGEATELGQWTSTAADGSSAALSVEPGPVAQRCASISTSSGRPAGPSRGASVRPFFPKHYVVVLRLRGDAPANQLQFKLVDPSGANVWWWRRREFAFPHETEALMLRKASLEFAWGPASGGEPERIGAVEFALAAGPGGSGTVWIEELRIEPRDPAAAVPRAHVRRRLELDRRP